MPRTILLRVLVALALVCLLAYLWPRRPTEAPRTAAPLPAPPAAKAATSGQDRPNVDPDERGLSLLAMLHRMLADRERRAHEALLTFRDAAALARFHERASASRLAVLDRSDALHTVRVRYDEPGALQRELAAHPDDYAEIAGNALISIPSAPGRENRGARDQVPFGNDTLAFLGADVDRGGWGRGVTIAIIDSGVAADATFGDRLRRIDVGRGLEPGKGEADGHGTSVAALAAGMAADAAGVAPDAGLLSIRVTDAEGVSDVFTVSRAIVAAVDAGAKVLNISLGGHSTSGALNAAIAYAVERGAVVVAAAGNDQAARLAWPAADQRVISVGAVDKAEQQVSFSNSGPQLKLSAPGYGVQTAWLDGRRAYVDGTSASAPLVAGAIAAVISQNPSLTSQQAAGLLLATASDAGAPGADPAFGGGILNLGWAMNRQTPGYVDVAVSSHHYDAERGEVQFVVQNRSSQAVTGATLDVTANGTARRFTVPTLAAGESHVMHTRVDAAALRPGNTLRFNSQVSAPAGIVDRVPANNQRGSVLAAPDPSGGG